MSDALDKLDNTRWVVNLDDHMRAAYAKMREQEESFLAELAEAGATVLRCEKPATDDAGPSRRALVLVPPGFKIPAGKKLIACVRTWQDMVSAAAEQQGKEPTVGTRGASLPVWLGPDNTDKPFTQARPAYSAKVVTHHLQQAFRGARLEPDDAMKVLRERLGRAESALQNSEKRGKRDRIERQAQAIADLKNAVVQLTALISQGSIVSVRIQSGLSWRISVRSEDKTSFTTTIATIGLIPAAADVTIKEAPTRNLKREPVEEISLPGGFVLYLRRKEGTEKPGT